MEGPVQPRGQNRAVVEQPQCGPWGEALLLTLSSPQGAVPGRAPAGRPERGDRPLVPRAATQARLPATVPDHRRLSLSADPDPSAGALAWRTGLAALSSPLSSTGEVLGREGE